MARITDVKMDRQVARPVGKTAAIARRGPAIWERVVRYLREVRAELTKVDWPSRTELVAATIVVVAVLLIMALYLGAWDTLFAWVFTRVLSR